MWWQTISQCFQARQQLVECNSRNDERDAGYLEEELSYENLFLPWANGQKEALISHVLFNLYELQ